MVEMTDKGDLAALAFKVQLWDGRRHVFARLYRGTLSAGDKICVAGSDTEERVARIFDVNAGNKKRIDTAVAGQIVLLAGLKTRAPETLVPYRTPSLARTNRYP